MISLLLQAGMVLAQEGETGSGTEPGSFLPTLLIIVVIGGVFYFLLIAPQRRRAKQVERVRSNVAVGDEIRTVGGIYGTVRSDDGDSLVIDIGGGNTLRIARRAVAEKVEDTES